VGLDEKSAKASKGRLFITLMDANRRLTCRRGYTVCVSLTGECSKEQRTRID
jgi:hypothetical protein